MGAILALSIEQMSALENIREILIGEKPDESGLPRTGLYGCTDTCYDTCIGSCRGYT